jgi:hypothetical protein
MLGLHSSLEEPRLPRVIKASLGSSSKIYVRFTTVLPSLFMSVLVQRLRKFPDAEVFMAAICTPELFPVTCYCCISNTTGEASSTEHMDGFAFHLGWIGG